ncbi:MAG TPA: GtrA family protein [Candidatus Kapabacteria bacterium]|nr:GtrA family protein [Candidatus Kapabacteria bacterium]
MIKRAAAYAWSVRHQFIKYFIVGASGVILDIGTLTLLKEVFGIMPVLAVVLNQILLLAYNFSLNKYWSFRNREIPHRQLIRYLILAGWNYTFSVGTMYIFSHAYDFDYRLVRIGSIMVMTLWNFILYKHWVYTSKAEDQMAV